MFFCMKRGLYGPIGFLLLAGALLTMPVSARADDDARDQEIARQALKEGRIKSLIEITEIVKTKMPGTILGVELDVENGRIVYEFDIVDPDGKLKEVEVDAATGDILKVEDDD
jgi:uncharacterized membrane protein YkoI